jgi:hypothetical protein
LTLIEEGKVKLTKKAAAPAPQQTEQKADPKLRICRGC